MFARLLTRARVAGRNGGLGARVDVPVVDAIEVRLHRAHLGDALHLKDRLRCRVARRPPRLLSQQPAVRLRAGLLDPGYLPEWAPGARDSTDAAPSAFFGCNSPWDDCGVK